MKARRTRCIVLVLDTALPFHRAVMSGIGAQMRATEMDWRLVIEKCLPDSLAEVDGLIADVETPGLEAALAGLGECPAVFVGSAMSAGVAQAQPRVVADNSAMVEMAVNHLRETGSAQLACFSRERYRGLPWAEERLQAFRSLAGPLAAVWEGGDDVQTLAWLNTLAPRTGVVAVNDSSARELLQLCAQSGRSIPRDVAVVGIDHDPVVAALSRLSISSVAQSAEDIGRKAADVLRRRMARPLEAQDDILVPPPGLHMAATSSKACSLVRGALDFIEAQLGRGIKAQQVADFLGVSRATLERTFLSQLGITVHDELLRRRITLAKHLLGEQALSTAEIARRCGFRTQQYMHVVFKRELGISPVEFAQSGEGSADA